MHVCTDIVMRQCVELLPASFFLGGQVEVRQDLTCGARAPLCGQRLYYTLIMSEVGLSAVPPQARRGQQYSGAEQKGYPERRSPPLASVSRADFCTPDR